MLHWPTITDERGRLRSVCDPATDRANAAVRHCRIGVVRWKKAFFTETAERRQISYDIAHGKARLGRNSGFLV